ncbi:MAG: DUF3825 domain-containing protein [Bacteroidales bacterium]|nr:DUF3825 domain-containing protein [Bacteroidales bacterium]
MAEQRLFKFAFFPKYKETIEYLAMKLAAEEQWDFSDSRNKNYSILKNYLEHTFRKIEEEDKIAYTQDNKYSCFNTGLVTRNLESIFALFEINKSNNNSKIQSSYYFKAFCKRSDAQFLNIFKSCHPDIADYFQNPESLIFNPNCELIPQIDHIIEDNIKRFPLHMQQLDNDEIRRRLTGAIDEVKKRIKTNYKLAVPQYYNGKIQLLLPLNLTPNSPNPDLALVTHKISDNVYTARTCLTLKMAYNNARLIVKPESSWLKP